MNKKTVIWGLCLVGMLFLLLGLSIFFLYSGPHPDRDPEDMTVLEHYTLVQAVPSDAAMLLLSDQLEETVRELNDSSLLLRSFFNDSARNNFSRFLSLADELRKQGGLKGLGHRPSVVSVHYSGSMVPLLIADAGHHQPVEAVSALRTLADSSGLYTAVTANEEGQQFLLVSSSEPLVLSSVRHLENGNSILDADGFSEAMAGLNGQDAWVVSHAYASKLLNAHFTRNLVIRSGFFRNFARWSVWIPGGLRDSRSVNAEGYAYGGNSAAFYSNVLNITPAGESQLVRILPVSTVSAFSLSFDGALSYLENYRHYLDAREELNRHQVDNEQLKSERGLSVDRWLEKLDVREVGKASFKAGDRIESVLLLRIRKEDPQILAGDTGMNLRQLRKTVIENAFPHYPAVCFGKFFSLEDESCAVLVDDWLVTGSEPALQDFLELSASPRKLTALLSESGLGDAARPEELNLFAFTAIGGDQECLRACLGTRLQADLERTLNGFSYHPVVLGMRGKAGGNLQFRYRSARLERIISEVEPEILLDTVVIVDQGPYPVLNFSTGKMNTLCQSANHSISLKNENGKSQWSIPFRQPICGNVETIDYYANGKLQFLFGAGSSLYLLDRLGRFVSGFPVRLDKEILLGPAAYDFTGAHGYTAVVLHTDNTIGMYNLHGETPEKWKGISSEEKILQLPELLELGDRHFWVVRTSLQTLVFPFYGGEPVFRNTGDRRLRPDTEIVPKGTSSISAICLDGKKHTVKLK